MKKEIEKRNLKKNLEKKVSTRRATRWRAVIIAMRVGFWDKPFFCYGLIKIPYIPWKVMIDL